MRKGYLKLFKKYPMIYFIAERIFSWYKRAIYFFRGSKPEERYWKDRHLKKRPRKKDDWGGVDTDWIESYKNSTGHPHRKFLIDRIASYQPSSVLEIGCNCGPNLFLLSRELPTAELTGVDINSMAVKSGKEWFKQEGIKNVKLFACKADGLERFENKSFDIVFTDAVLIYFGPDKIKNVITEILRISKKVIILFEWNDFVNLNNSQGKFFKHWVRNYNALFREFVDAEKIKTEKIPENIWQDDNWQKHGAIVEIMISDRK